MRPKKRQPLVALSFAVESKVFVKLVQYFSFYILSNYFLWRIVIMLVRTVQSKLDSTLNTVGEDGVKRRFHIFFLVERQGVEPCERITTLYRLAICCITVLPSFHYTQLLFSNNICGPWSKHSSVDNTSWYSFLNTASSNF